MQRLPFTPKDLVPFVEPLIDNPRDAEKLARPFYAILSSGSARKGDWARHYRKEAGERTNYKAIERLMVGLEPELLQGTPFGRDLRRLIDSETPFVQKVFPGT